MSSSAECTCHGDGDFCYYTFYAETCINGVFSAFAANSFFGLVGVNVICAILAINSVISVLSVVSHHDLISCFSCHCRQFDSLCIQCLTRPLFPALIDSTVLPCVLHVSQNSCFSFLSVNSTMSIGYNGKMFTNCLV